MSIRMKLLLSYAAMLVIPIIMMIILSLLMIVFFRGDLQNMKGLYETTEQRFDHENTEHIVKELSRSVKREPELLLDRGYLDELTTELKDEDAGIVVRIGDAIIYQSSSMDKIPAVTADLPPYSKKDAYSLYPLMKEDNASYSFVQFDFSYRDNEQGTLFIISKVDPLMYYIRQYFPTLFIALICVLVLTHVLLTAYMSKQIIRPLRALRNAAREIKEGNLDFELKIDSRDETGQLGIAFEEMRSRLQHSLQMQAQYEENRKELIASISHDLRTPLTAIQGYIDGIMDGVADTPEKSQKYMQTIARKAEEMEHLIQELFLYSKLDLNRQPFHMESVKLLPLLLDWSEELQFELEKRGIVFDRDIRIETDTVVSLDMDHFKRVLNNIIQNSVRYMDKPTPKIRLLAYCREDQAIMEITDNGVGIEPHALAHIFERFFRADESRSAHTGGSGLGLAIAKQIMEGHGGTIEAASKLTVGTVITLSLPITSDKGMINDEESTAH
ncbi:signal transduction histidine kinase [Paenibacillus cellulosilyticus]|uniref:histidine kinase n=1 Tax=Paenibacillus cellulosilyticus TaxID=375489 RepID=A0A2V2YX63_9BACL|nr:HAMP domain-containing sensor histidine kinase [Paenibacillus cellulosilyticus]PWW04778.1 signal transduction histidine kinase [Paenibacillus cellulosilyticus]QKS45901.1 HAMP domain-containing histidine kinase [Paenibacillus cellulosilyticus]